MQKTQSLSVIKSMSRNQLCSPWRAVVSPWSHTHNGLGRFHTADLGFHYSLPRLVKFQILLFGLIILILSSAKKNTESGPPCCYIINTTWVLGFVLGTLCFSFVHCVVRAVGVKHISLSGTVKHQHSFSEKRLETFFSLL